jgi:hypothetical protein
MSQPIQETLMKAALSLILCAVCASAQALTVDELAGPWVMDVEASVPLLEAQFRKQGMDDERIATLLAPMKTEAPYRFFEFGAETVSSYQERDGTRSPKDELRIDSLTPDQETLVFVIKETKVVLRLRGDKLEMESHEGADPDMVVTFILKRPAATAAAPAAPAPAPALPTAPAPAPAAPAPAP